MPVGWKWELNKIEITEAPTNYSVLIKIWKNWIEIFKCQLKFDSIVDYIIGKKSIKIEKLSDSN